jgi:hypothetical protein
MKLPIVPNMTIAYLNETFRFFYPNLKLVFFKKSFLTNVRLAENNRITNENIALNDLNEEIPKGEINIADKISTANFETDFREKFGLHVQVFRRSGNLWLLTTLSDAHSLQEQEVQAENSLKTPHYEPEFIDYREQD